SGEFGGTQSQQATAGRARHARDLLVIGRDVNCLDGGDARRLFDGPGDQRLAQQGPHVLARQSGRTAASTYRGNDTQARISSFTLMASAAERRPSSRFWLVCRR